MLSPRLRASVEETDVKVTKNSARNRESTTAEAVSAVSRNADTVSVRNIGLVSVISNKKFDSKFCWQQLSPPCPALKVRILNP